MGVGERLLENDLSATSHQARAIGSRAGVLGLSFNDTGFSKELLNGQSEMRPPKRESTMGCLQVLDSGSIPLIKGTETCGLEWWKDPTLQGVWRSCGALLPLPRALISSPPALSGELGFGSHPASIFIGFH